MALLFLENFTIGSYFTCRVLETSDQHYGKEWPLSKPGDEGDDGECDGLACDTEGTLALESRGYSSRPRSLSLTCTSFVQAFSLLWIVFPCLQRRNED